MKRFFLAVLAAFLLLPQMTAGAVSTSAHAAVLIDGASGAVLYEHNAHERLAMASTTKIMTALLLCEQPDLSKTITITEPMIRTEGTSMGLRIGDEVPYESLLYGMLLCSGNDAANATAVAVGGSIEKFVTMMNEKAIALGLNDTHFNTPSGLDGDAHYTTAVDLANLARFALQNERFAVVCAKKHASLSYGGTVHYFSNHNRLLSSVDGAVGVKTGYTSKAGRCLVSAVRRDGALLIAVTLNDRDDWDDHAALYEYGFSPDVFAVSSFGADTYSVPVVAGEKETVAVPVSAVTLRHPVGTTIEVSVCLPPFLYAPVKEGDIVGMISYYDGDCLIGRQNLVVGEAADKEESPTFFVRLLTHIKNLLVKI